MKKKLFLFFPLIATLLTSCTSYVSKYRAKFLVTTNNNTSSSMTFGEFKGRYVIKMKKASPGEGAIVYEGSLKEGNINVFYVIDYLPGKKDEFENNMFTLSNNENKSGQTGYVEKGYNVTIVIDSEEISKEGNLSFKFSN